MRLFIAFLLILPAISFAKKSEAAKYHSDQQLFVMIRKKAPFWLKDKDIELRINKDGTATAGKWKIEKGLLKVTFTETNEVKTWPVDIGDDRSPTIGGVALKSGRYELIR